MEGQRGISNRGCFIMQCQQLAFLKPSLCESSDKKKNNSKSVWRKKQRKVGKKNPNHLWIQVEVLGGGGGVPSKHQLL